MRLRLRVLRNELPPVNTIWPIPDTQKKLTVAQLLDAVNNVFPLEAADWGVEDYVVEINSFECIQWREVREVCRDEDEVVIRPMQYVELKQRLLLGRDRIHESGIHVYDGIPWGKPAFKTPRPFPLRIPPRKRARLTFEDGDEEEDVDAMEAMEYESDSEDELPKAIMGSAAEDLKELEEDDEDDEDEEDYRTEEESTDSSEDDEDDDTPEADRMAVERDVINHNGPDDATSDSSDDSSDSDNSDSDSSSEDDTDSSTVLPPKHVTFATPNTDTQSLGSRVTISSKKRKAANSEGSTNQQGDQKKLKETSSDSSQTHLTTPTQGGLPHEGKPSTRDRNARRRDSKRLKFLKKEGKLPKEAGLDALHALKEPDGQVSSMSDFKHSSLSKETPLPATEADNDTNIALMTERRQKLLNDIASGGVDITSKSAVARTQDDSDDEGPEETSSKTPMTDDAVTGVDAAEVKSKQATMIPASITARARLNLNGTKRMIMGSLGVGVPRTEAERDVVQKKLAAGPKRAVSARQTAAKSAASEVERVDAVVEDNESWRDKIELDAVECSIENLTLTQPPFPFHQRWDDQFRRNKRRQRVSSEYAAHGGRKRKRGQQGSSYNGDYYVETYDKYNTDGNGDALDYDDETPIDEYWEEDALLGDDAFASNDDAASHQLLAEAASQAVVDDFPPLPADITTLPALTESEAKMGDFVAYTTLSVSEATKWQPLIVTRTVQLQQKQEDGWLVKVAQRDLQQKRFGEDGQRIYGKFEQREMSDDEGEEEDQQICTMKWEEFGTARLLLRKDSEAEAEAGAE